MLKLTRNITKLSITEAFINCNNIIRNNKKILTTSKCHYNNQEQYPVVSNTQIYLKNLKNGSDIFLIGTAHVSKKSVEEVKEAINCVKPDIVFVELCEKRALRIKSNQLTENFSIAEMFKTLYKGMLKGPSGISLAATEVSFKGFYRLINIIMGLEPGLEFKVAMEEGEKINAKLIYGDKPQEEIIKRISQSINIFDIFRLLMPVSHKVNVNVDKMNDFEASIEAIKNRAVVREMLKFIEGINPKLANALVHERDEFMTNNLLKLQGRVVAVVGLGHLDGIEKIWEEKQLINHNKIDDD